MKFVFFVYSSLLFALVLTVWRAHAVKLEKEYGAKHDAHDGPTLEDIRNSMQDQKRSSRVAAGERMRAAPFPLLYQDVVFIVIYMQDGTGKVPYSALVAQIAELNRDFSGEDAIAGGYALASDARVRFRLGGVRYIQNDEFHMLCANTDTQEQFRPRYMANAAKNLNVYICHAATNLGLSWLPYQSYAGVVPSEDSFVLGVTVHWELLPNNTLLGGRWNKGKICTHEFGHHYGLRHLYDGGCDQPDEFTDQIDDTPRQSGNPVGSCATLKGRDSCPNQPGVDDNSNYMGIAFDSCRNHFTPGQVLFMQNTILARKPMLVSQPPPDCVAAVDSTDGSPDLAPCLEGQLYQDDMGRAWCKTDPDNKRVWAWACCPSLNQTVQWGSERCRQGTPDFTVANSGVLGRLPLGGPTESPTLPTLSPTPQPSGAPTNPPTFRPTLSPTLKSMSNYSSSNQPTLSPSSSNSASKPSGGKRVPQCNWVTGRGGPAMENMRCQLPFRLNNQMYNLPIPASVVKPFSWHLYRALQENAATLWCPLNGTLEYVRSSETLRMMWGPAQCV